MKHKYEIIIYWSDDDGAYVADVPKLPGCMSRGKGYQLALAAAHDGIDAWIETAKSIGRKVPRAKRRRLMLA